jgi:hypothetical protein
MLDFTRDVLVVAIGVFVGGFALWIWNELNDR